MFSFHKSLVTPITLVGLAKVGSADAKFRTQMYVPGYCWNKNQRLWLPLFFLSLWSGRHSINHRQIEYDARPHARPSGFMHTKTSRPFAFRSAFLRYAFSIYVYSWGLGVDFRNGIQRTEYTTGSWINACNSLILVLKVGGIPFCWQVFHLTGTAWCCSSFYPFSMLFPLFPFGLL